MTNFTKTDIIATFVDIDLPEYGYNNHSYKISSELLPTLDIPKEGDIIQFGCGVGVTIEKLCELYGSKRVYGYDIFNPLNHPRIFSFDGDSFLRSPIPSIS